MEPWRRNFRLIWLNNFITALGMMSFLPLFPLYLRSIGMEDEAEIGAWSGILVAGAPFTAAFLGPFWGALGDQVGRKAMLVRANLAITVFVLLMSFARTPELLLILRLLQGVFSGFVPPALTLVTVAVPEDRQGRVTGNLHTSVLAGSMCGPLVGGLIGDTIGMRWAFVVASLLSLVAAVMVVLFVKEERTEAQSSRRALPSDLPVLLRSSLRSVFSLFAASAMRRVLLVVFVVRFGATMAVPMLALYVAQLGDTPESLLGTVTGLVFSATALATLLVTPLWGRRGDRKGHERTLAVCVILAGAATLPQAFVTGTASLYVLRFLSGSFAAGLFPTAYALAAVTSSREKRGGAHGLTFSSIGFANALGYATGGVIAGWIGIRGLFVVSAILMVGAGLPTLLSRKRNGSGERSLPRDEGS